MTPRTRQLVCLLALLSALGAVTAAHAYVPADEYTFSGHYMGVLVCDDCSGIWTDLTLQDLGLSRKDIEGDFTLTERYTGGVHGRETHTIRGRWFVIDRNRDGSASGTLELHADPLPDGTVPETRYFHCDRGQALELLGKGHHLPAGTAQTELHRVVPPPDPEFLVRPAQAGSTIHGRIGDQFTIQLPVASLAVYRTTWTMKPPSSQAVLLHNVTSFGERDHYAVEFTLKADSPGTAHVEFTNATDPSQHLAFVFNIQR